MLCHGLKNFHAWLSPSRRCSLCLLAAKTTGGGTDFLIVAAMVDVSPSSVSLGEQVQLRLEYLYDHTTLENPMLPADASKYISSVTYYIEGKEIASSSSPDRFEATYMVSNLTPGESYSVTARCVLKSSDKDLRQQIGGGYLRIRDI